MKRTFRNAALFSLLAGMSGLAHADEYILAQPVRIDLPGMVQLLNKTTKCRVIAKLKAHASTVNGTATYEVVAKREICPDGPSREVHLHGRLRPSIEGRIAAGTTIELAPVK